MSRTERDMAERFARETAAHEMTVLHDDGLYRHLRFQQPGTGMYWFELVTWPGKLAFAGDVDGYAFSCTPDMLGFFRQSSWQGGINPTYWDEKVIASHDSVMTYSQDLFNKQVADDLKEAEEHYPGVTKAWNEKVNGDLAEYNTEHEHDARAALNDFEYLPEGASGEPFRFYDAWEWQLKDYNWSFLWCCHAIVWGIAQYDKAKTLAPAESSPSQGGTA
ncbi:hypothetical protein FHR32_005070 [Streptosporangium album]|uniref:Uncharacterized protein n=1 Tax=Streptosporangium album TaxID=47479 RepID=A0A7W7WBB3_9ACTN|nr:hypothetical protein [Streptosporangium album]MBB4940693.1 hypothetical protein [Streptosporangium album]